MLTRSPYVEPQQPVFNPDIQGDLELVTPPSGQVVTTAEAIEWARAIPGVDDALVTSLLEAAINYVEEVAIPGKRLLRTTTFDLPLRCWWGRDLRLPRPPLQSVGSVTYYDTTDTLQALATTFYEVRSPWKQPGLISLRPCQVWPPLSQVRTWSVVVRFTAGYPVGTVPECIKMALRFLVSHWYDDRRISPVNEAMGNTVANLCSGDGFGSYR